MNPVFKCYRHRRVVVPYPSLKFTSHHVRAKRRFYELSLVRVISLTTTAHAGMLTLVVVKSLSKCLKEKLFICRIALSYLLNSLFLRHQCYSTLRFRKHTGPWIIMALSTRILLYLHFGPGEVRRLFSVSAEAIL